MKMTPATRFKKEFLARTRTAREAVGMSQEAMAQALEPGMKQDTYKQYEIRTPLPHRYIPTFCAITKVDIEWLFTERGKGVKMPKPIRTTHRAAA